jgi:TonB family protein
MASLLLVGAGTGRAAPRTVHVSHPKLVKFVRAPYPAAARTAGRTGVVVMHVTVNAQGQVAGVKVVTSAGADLDRAAVWAVKQFVYRPATVGGKRVAARIKVSYPFRLRARARVRTRPRARARGRVRTRARLRARPRKVVTRGQLTGVVREKGTRNRLGDAEIVVFRLGAKGGAGARVLARAVARAHADDQGRFRLNLPAGRYRVAVRVVGCFAFRVIESLAPGTRLSVEYYVERLVYDPYQTVVVAKALRKEITRYSVPVEVVEKIPGTQGDALRAIQNMPGVGRASFSLGFLLVRGSDPRNTRVLLEGHVVPQLYHFMGLSSVFNSDLIRRMDFMPGNFSVRYGRATGGIIDVFSRRPRTDGWHGYLDADLWDVGALVEGPVGKGSLALSLRRAHIDAILALLPDIALTAAYYDYQALFDYPVGGGRLRIIAFGADDRLKRRIEDTTRFDTVHVTLFAKTIAAWRRRWGSHRLRLSAAGGYTRTESGAGPDAVEDTGRMSWRLHYSHDVGRGLNLALGTVGEVARARLSTGPSALSLDLLDNQATTTEAAPAIEIWSTVVSQAVYVEATWKPTPRLTLIPGLRGEYFRAAQVSRFVFDPRVTARLSILPKKLDVSAAVGLFHQEPQLERIHSITGGNPVLRHERAMHVALGVSWRIRRSMALDITGFYKRLWGVIAETDAMVFREGEVVAEHLANQGRGRIYGGELLLKKASDRDCPRWLKAQKCFAWLSYTLLRSERQFDPGGPWELFEDDQTHLFTFVVSAAWSGGWALGIRFRLASGRPQDFYTAGFYDADENTYVGAPGSIRSGRMPLFHQLDIRVDKRFVFKRWMLALYLDIQNVYSYQASEFVQYNYNYTRYGMLKGLPIVPSFGIRGEF